ncbi:MAG: hypothetical protein AB7N65_14725 [Vicinamibacterales bacterium]
MAKRDADAREHRPTPEATSERAQLSQEIGSEGGTPGDVENRRTSPAGSGSEATETWRRPTSDIDEIRHDETGPGRRSPVGPES